MSEPEEVTTAERFAAIAQAARANNLSLQAMARGFMQFAEALPPVQRVLASAFDEYNRRMAEINRHSAKEASNGTQDQ